MRDFGKVVLNYNVLHSTSMSLMEALLYSTFICITLPCIQLVDHLFCAPPQNDKYLYKLYIVI